MTTGFKEVCSSGSGGREKFWCDGKLKRIRFIILKKKKKKSLTRYVNLVEGAYFYYYGSDKTSLEFHSMIQPLKEPVIDEGKRGIDGR